MRLFFLKNLIILSFLISGFFSVSAQGTLIDFNTIPKNGTILIYAHSDDDLIWMLPFWSITEKFIGGAMPRTPSFERIVSQQQEFINNNGFNIEYASNWITPWGAITQQEYDEYYWQLNPAYQYLANDYLRATWWDGNIQTNREEINRIKAKLEQYIADPGVIRVMTHSNWGEYGHLHHVALNKAVRELAVKYSKDVWMLGCTISLGVFIDIDVPNGISYTSAGFSEPDLYRGIRSIYIDNGCWTWLDYEVPSGDHKFIKIIDGGVDKSDILTGENVSVTGPSQLEEGAFIFDGEDDYLTLQGNNSSSFTIGMRIRPDRIRAMDISKMADYPSSGTFDRNFYLNNDGRISASIYDGSRKVVTSNTALAAGEWYQIAMTGNGSNLKIYVNGALEGNISAGTAITGYPTPEFILGQGTTTSFFEGQINDVRMYDYAMTDSEIAGLFGTGYTITASAGTGGSVNPGGEVTVYSGASRTFTFIPAEGFKISDVKVDNNSVGKVSSYTFSNINADHSVSVSFTPATTFTITSSAGNGGSITPSGNITVYEETDQTYRIAAASGFRIADVIVDNISVGVLSAYSFYGIKANHTISVAFAPIPTYAISSSSGTGGSISPAGIVTVNEGASQSFSITPFEGYQISRVSVDGVSVGSVTNYTFSNVNTSHTIGVEFIPSTYTITSSAEYGGSISPAGTFSANHGSVQTYNITANTGYRISDVRVDDISIGAVSVYTFSNIVSSHTISASFTLISYTITGSAGAGGSVNPQGEVTVNHGTTRSFTVTPDYGYHISGVTVDNVPVGAVSTYTFNNITADHVFSATFALNSYLISVSSGTGGSISPHGEIAIEHGSSRTFIISADEGYHISDVMADNNSLGPVSSYTFNNIIGNHTISATFTPKIYTFTVSAGPGGSITPAESVSAIHGTDKSFKIIPEDGYKISDVKVDDISLGSLSDYYFPNITTDHTISVTFIPLNTYTIRASSGAGGFISPAGQVTVYEGKDQTYSIIPNAGYRIENVIVDNNSIGVVSEYTFNSVSYDHKISATFTSDIEVKVFPNPFRDEFKVKIASPEEDQFDLYVYDIFGKIIYTQRNIFGNTTTSVSLQAPPGTYIIRLHNNVSRLSVGVVKHY